MKIRVCPNCGSINITQQIDQKTGKVQYRCNVCGYVGDYLSEKDITKDIR